MRNNIPKPFILLSLLLCSIVLTTCKKLEKEMLVSTGEVTGISVNTADATGTVIDLGDGATQHGHCYGTSPNVSTTGSNLKTQLGVPPTGGFTSQLTGLIAGTKYYIKAYITDGTKTAYGDEISFTTLAAAGPELTTTAVSSITTTTAASGGNITSDGGATVTARGVCWNTATGPSISNSKTTDGAGTGSFTSNLSSLTPGTTYYVRAYATNSAGTSYGNELTFTSVALLPPTVTTTAISTITTTTAMSGGSITNDGGASITARGVCWSATTGPTTADSKTTDATGTGNYTSVITGLVPGTTYYVRAYATNSAGTSYGNELSFITTPGLPSLTTTTVTSLTQTTATGGGNITGDGGSSVTFRGVCWSTVSGPTTSSSKTTDGTGSGIFSSSLTGLTANTTYYVRAYAINNAGTAYGNELTFTTSPGVPVVPTLSTTAITSITQNTATSGGNITSDGGASVTARGVCWSTVTGPTISGNKTSDATGSGVFVSNITGLTASTKYYVRAYATNSVGTSYGSELSFTTSAIAPVVPTLTTTAISGITQTGASSGGNITSDGGASVTARGVCWSTTTSPTISGDKTSDATGSGAFVSTITGLTASTKYYVRAYATNSVGTSYGDELSFTTSSVAAVVPTLTTTAVSALASTSVSSGGNITSDGGASVTARGVCWNTAASPTISNSKTSDGTGSGSFVSSLTGLTANTIYYVRSYATNSAGTAYGSEISFTTTIQLADFDVNTYNTVQIGTQLWMKENLKVTHYRNGNPIPIVADNTEWSNLTSGAYSLFNTDAFYNYYATVDNRNLCPTGWHVPTHDEWTILENYLISNGFNYDGTTSGNKIAKSLATTTIWPSSTTEGAIGNTDYPEYRNKSGFSALPSGTRGSNGTFADLGIRSYLLSSSEFSASNARGRSLSKDQSWSVSTSTAKTAGQSVRCVQGEGQVLPAVTTTSISAITTNGASSGGNITSDGGASVTARGICWSTLANPTVALTTKTTDGTGSGSYTSSLIGLTESTTFYVRAYATNSVGTAYGNEVSFTTNPAVMPTLSTTAVTDITGTTATSGGNITSDGGGSISVRGVCWDVTSPPTTGDSRTLNGPGTGTYVSNLTGLTPNTTYYVRAYATNSAGTAYGNEVPFATAKIAPTATTSAATDITPTAVTLNGTVNANNDVTSVYFDYGLTTSYGSTYAAVPSPISTSTATAVSTIIPGLPGATTYHFRVWAQNSAGTTYGNDMTFNTLCGPSFIKTHTSGDVAPVGKTVNYGTVETNLSGAAKCWITQNLGSDNQAASAADATEAAAGWYWQFNRKQGYKHDGTIRTPNTTWITPIDENSDWTAANDPCTILLGTGWRIPTYTEWSNADNNGGWNNYDDSYSSVLKLHAAGGINNDGTLSPRGDGGSYWSSKQNTSTSSWYLLLGNSLSGTYYGDFGKVLGFTVRCLKD
jgi:uncharacterized protein (TIGR02145 family)